jgi:hypothetical protein
MRNELFADGICIAADIYDLDSKIYSREELGVITITRPMTLQEWERYGPQPLDAVGVLATLLVVEGVLPITDAANAVHLTPQDLINEAHAWAVGTEP